MCTAAPDRAAPAGWSLLRSCVAAPTPHAPSRPKSLAPPLTRRRTSTPPSPPIMAANALRHLAPRPDVYPLIAAVTAGCSFGVYSIYKHLSHNPDVKFSPATRGAAPWEQGDELYEQGVRHGKEIAKHYRHRDNDIGHRECVVRRVFWRRRGHSSAFLGPPTPCINPTFSLSAPPPPSPRSECLPGLQPQLLVAAAGGGVRRLGRHQGRRVALRGVPLPHPRGRPRPAVGACAAPPRRRRRRRRRGPAAPSSPRMGEARGRGGGGRASMPYIDCVFPSFAPCYVCA